jgi:hypothetical protein
MGVEQDRGDAAIGEQGGQEGQPDRIGAARDLFHTASPKSATKPASIVAIAFPNPGIMLRTGIPNQAIARRAAAMG